MTYDNWKATNPADNELGSTHQQKEDEPMRYRIIMEVEAHPQMPRKQFNDQLRRLLDCGVLHREFGNVVYVATDVASDTVITHDGRLTTFEP